MLTSSAGWVIQHEGRQLGQSIIFLEGFLKKPIVSRDVPPSRQPFGRIQPTGAFPQLLPALLGGTNAGAAPGGAGASQPAPCPQGAPWEGMSKPLPSGDDGDRFLLMLARYPGAVNTPSPTASAVTYLVYKIVL